METEPRGRFILRSVNFIISQNSETYFRTLWSGSFRNLTREKWVTNIYVILALNFKWSLGLDDRRKE